MADFDLPEGATLDAQANSNSHELPEGAALDPYTGQSVDNIDTSTPLGKANKVATEWANRNSMEYLPWLVHTLNSFGKGIPIAGQLLGDTPGQQQFETEHPHVDTAARIGGAAASMIPMSAAALLPEAGVGANAVTQGGLFGSLGVGDKAAQKYSQGGMDAVKNTPASDYASRFGIDALFGAAGPVAGKIISPLAKTPPRLTTAEPVPSTIPSSAYTDLASHMSPEEVEALQKQFADPEFISRALSDENVLREALGQPTQSSNQVIADAVNKGNQAAHKSKLASLDLSNETKEHIYQLASTGIGYAAHGVDGGILGAILGPSIKYGAENLAVPAITKIAKNQIMSSPARKAILNSVLGTSGIAVNQDQ